jgi:hypothetical protein
MPDTESPQDSAALEGLFEPGWDHARDVLVVVGRSAPGFYQALLERGQARVVEIAPSDSLDAPPPAPYQRASDALDLFRAILSFPGAAPTNAAFRRQPGADLPPSLLASLTDALHSAVTSHASYQQTVDDQAPVWAGQGVANLARVAELPATPTLDGAFAGLPCVIVSPGPSLERNVHLLRELAGRSVIMTCSHALRALEVAGVVPDIVAIADPKHIAVHFEGLDTTAPAAFVCDAIVSPKSFALPVQRFFTYATHSAVDDWIFGAMSESAFLDSGGSVACVELSLAQRMGCDPIVFVGQDLSFSGGRYYAASSVDGGVSVVMTGDGNGLELLRPTRDEDTGEPCIARHPAEQVSEVPAWGGGTVKTSASLRTFLLWFRVAARVAAQRLYNCTEGGAYIDGMEHIRLREFIDQHELPAVDVPAVLDRAAASVDVTVRRRTMHASVEGMLAGLEACVNVARECSRLAERAGRDSTALDDLGRAEARLARAIAPLPFLSMLSQQRIRAAQERALTAATLEENLVAAEQIFGVVREAGRTLLAPLRASLEALSD